MNSLVRIKKYAFIAFLPFLLLQCKNESNNQSIKTIELNIRGMVCNGCAESIQSTLSKRKGILKNHVNYPKKSAVITFDGSLINEIQIKETIKEAGYEASK